MSTSVIDRIESDAWGEEWDRLFKHSPKKTFKWTKKILQRQPKETNAHFYFRVYFSHLVSAGMRALGQGWVPLTDEKALESILFTNDILGESYTPLAGVTPVQEELGRFLHLFSYWDAVHVGMKAAGNDMPRRAFFDARPDDAMADCIKAAGWALENFSSATYKEIQENARRAGSVIKFGLEALLNTAHLTPTAAARNLGCSRQTIYNLRSHYSDILDLSTGEVFDESRL